MAALGTERVRWLGNAQNLATYEQDCADRCDLETCVATQEDVRRIARSLPEVVEDDGHFAFSVLRDGKTRGFVWVWMERINPKRPRVARPGVIAARIPDEFEKEAMLADSPDKFFTEPHYNGFPAVLVRLDAVGEDELAALITEAWRSQAPPALVRDYEIRESSSQ